MKTLITIALNKGVDFNWIQELSRLDDSRKASTGKIKEYIKRNNLRTDSDHFRFRYFDERVTLITSWLCGCKYPDLSSLIKHNEELEKDVFSFEDLMVELRLNKELKEVVSKYFTPSNDNNYDFIGDLECIIERLRRFYAAATSFLTIDEPIFQKLLYETLRATINERDFVFELLKVAHLLNCYVPSLPYEEGLY